MPGVAVGSDGEQDSEADPMILHPESEYKLLKIVEDEQGFLTISRPPFETVFNKEEVREIKTFFSRNIQQSEPILKGELEYGSILPNGEDWRLRKYDTGMGETEYRIFRNEKFFAQFDNRNDADVVMTAMTCTQQSERNKVLDDIELFRKTNSKEYSIYSMWVMEAQYLQELRIIKQVKDDK